MGRRVPLPGRRGGGRPNRCRRADRGRACPRCRVRSRCDRHPSRRAVRGRPRHRHRRRGAARGQGHDSGGGGGADRPSLDPQGLARPLPVRGRCVRRGVQQGFDDPHTGQACVVRRHPPRARAGWVDGAERLVRQRARADAGHARMARRGRPHVQAGKYRGLGRAGRGVRVHRGRVARPQRLVRRGHRGRVRRSDGRQLPAPRRASGLRSGGPAAGQHDQEEGHRRRRRAASRAPARAQARLGRAGPT